jgi:glycolate oxidase iron-sulfur subunit
MIERLVKKNDVLGDAEWEALTACTLCRACETVCPSKMDYGGLYRQAMEADGTGPRKGPAIALLLSIIAERRSAQRSLNALLHLYRRSGMQRLLRRLPVSPLAGGFKQLEALLPAPYDSETVPTRSRAATAARQGEVALFTGCVANVLDTKTHNATIKLLTRLGYDVRVPEKQTCCGAIHAHNGDIARAKALARKNIDAFSGNGPGSVIYNSSGCGAFLSEYDALLNDGSSDGEPAQRPPIVDIMDFLAANDRIGDLSFRGLRKRVAVHEPCSQRNVLKTHDVIYRVLQRIPDLDVVSLPDNAMCCGAGGTKMVTQPELASPPRDEKVRALLDSEADILLSTNFTCALHLARGIREAGRQIAVLHPVSLLAQQMV